jgi:hypothetical protein
MALDRCQRQIGLIYQHESNFMAAQHNSYALPAIGYTSGKEKPVHRYASAFDFRYSNRVLLAIDG